MALLTPDQSNPLGTLPGAMLKGLEMRQMMAQQLDQHNELQQRMAQNAQKAQWENITNQMALEGNSRAVNNGMVADDSPQPPTPQQQTGPAPGPAAPAPNATPANRTPIPQAAAPGVAQAAPIAQPAGPIMRKADASRTVTYTDAQGNKQQRELLTPQEQVQRQIAAKKATEEGTGIPVDIPDATAPGGKRRTYVDPNVYAEILRSQTQAQPVVKGPDGNFSTVGPDGKPTGTVPVAAMGSTVRYENSQAATNMRGSIADANNDTKTNIALGNNATSENNAATRADATTTAATTRANATTGAATIHANAAGNPKPATVGQSAVMNRFDTKRMDGIAKEEQGYNATRVSVGALLGAGKDEKGADMTPASRTMLQARYNNATAALQNAQFRKAQVLKTPQPPADRIAGMGNGDKLVSDDGHVWTKNGDVVYLVK